MSKKLKVSGGAQAPPRPLCQHRQGGEVKPVKIGKHTIWAGGGMYIQPEELERFDCQIDLRAEKAGGVSFGTITGPVLHLPIKDYNIVADTDWTTWSIALNRTYQMMFDQNKVIVYCAGGHGRTGLFLASLLALTEPNCEEPVEEIRKRYCYHAVETPAQYEQVMRFALETKAAHAAKIS